MSKNRNYSCKDEEMLVVGSTISESFTQNITEFSPIRANWTPAYAEDLAARIKSTMEKYFGKDIRKQLRNATMAVYEIAVPAKKSVAMFKTQVETDFKSLPARLEEILKTLGIGKNLKKMNDGNQQSLIKLIYSFQSGMTDELKQELTSKGMNAALIDTIISYASTLMEANVTQEGFKGTTKEFSKEVTAGFNALYDEIIGICKIASKHFNGNQVKKDMFTFNKVLANLGGTRSSASAEEPVTPAS